MTDHAPRTLPLLAGLLIAGTAGCLATHGMGDSEFEEDPRRALADPPPIEIAVERLGIDGHVTGNEPVVLVYRVANGGPRSAVTLELHEWPPPENVPWAFSLAANVPPLPLELAAGESRRGEWILTSLTSYAMIQWNGDGEVLLLVRGPDGAVLGAASLPELKRANRPVAVIAADSDVALAVQEAVHRSDIGADYGRRDVALVLGEPPQLWYEYESLGAAILARPWGDLSAAARLALRRWTAYGGHLIVLPERCPDWRAADLAAALPGAPPVRYGSGTLQVAPSPDDAAAADWETWLGRALPLRGYGDPPWQPTTPPLELHYVMPDAALLVALIALIVVLCGPVAHLVLVRLRRREWAWLVLPVLSLLLAGCMYAVATSVKGEASALELHHVVESRGDAPDATVTTAVRVLSAAAGPRTLEVTGDQPRASLPYTSPFGEGGGPRAVEVRRDGAALIDIPLHRFSSHDASFTFTAVRQPLRVERLGETGLRVVNTGAHELTDLWWLTGAGWHELVDRLPAGATFERTELGPGRLPAPPDALADPQAWWRHNLLASAAPRYDGAGSVDAALVAGCRVADLPRVTLAPGPETVREVTTCVWRLPPDDGATR